MEAQIENLDWYHPYTTRHMAESMLMQNGDDGTYMMRSAKQGGFALSVRCKDSVKHFTLNMVNNTLKFGHGDFSTIQELMDHFDNKPLLGSESGQLILLSCPYPRVIDEPELYETVTVHAEASAGDPVRHPPDFSVNSKEGYLTKIGYYFKTWRTRWFVLQKNELKYFKDKSHTIPLKVLDLNECTECTKDPNAHPEKNNVFRVKFNWRTFYMHATTDQDANEWVKVISWRIKKGQERENMIEDLNLSNVHQR